MKKRLPVILALVFGLLAALLTYLYLQRQRADLGAPKTYLAAAADISKGAKFTDGNVVVKKLPEKYAPVNAVEVSDRMTLIGTQAVVNIRKDQVLLWEYVESGIGRGGLSSLLQKGERAITIPVSNISGLEGMLQPNDRVDILGTFVMPDEGKQKTITRLLMQNVTILAVGSRFGHSWEKDYPSVTLKVSPQEAELLTFAEQHGQLRLILRGADDVEIESELPTVDFSNLLSIEEKATNIRKSSREPKVIYH